MIVGIDTINQPAYSFRWCKWPARPCVVAAIAVAVANSTFLAWGCCGPKTAV